MTFCMLTTFFGPHSFGGDAAFVDRLSRALARHGHEVHVIYCQDAFEISRGEQPPRSYETPPGVIVHALRSSLGRLSPLATHQTGRPFLKKRAILRLLADIQPDVLHFHNLSLIGGPGLLAVPSRDAVKLMTTHEHWLVCPQHVLWKLDRELCEAPSCIRCCLAARKPPQWWRSGEFVDRHLRHLDALICPSRSTQEQHARRGIHFPTVRLPYFLPRDYTGRPPAPIPSHERPYLTVAGRLEAIKGFQDVIDAMASFPGIDLRIAGMGSYERNLRDRAARLPNVHFEGRLTADRLAALIRGAMAVVVPSLVYETFGYVVLEAFAERTPVIVRDLGALPELVAESRGGLTFSTSQELVDRIEMIVTNDHLRKRLGLNGFRARHTVWSEGVHIERYLALVDACRIRRRLGAGPVTEIPDVPNRHMSQTPIARGGDPGPARSTNNKSIRRSA